MRWVAAALAAAVVISTLIFPASARPEPVEVRSIPITHFRLGSGDSRFGDLEFVGGFEMRSPARMFGQLSSFRFLSPGASLVGVADHGYWFFADIERDADFTPIGVANFRMQAMVDESGRVITEKPEKDAEALDVHDGIATVAFEREARVSEYRLNPDAMGGPIRHLDFIVPRRELRFNQGFETLARAPLDGALQGARIVISERSIDGDGNIFAAILEGPQRGLLKVKRSHDFDVTDGVFLPDGDLLLLERRFSMATGVAMRLRRIAGETVRQGALLDGAILLEANLGYNIDNMEGLDAWRRGDGKLIVALLSDDNQSFLQRTLYLEFVLAE